MVAYSLHNTLWRSNNNNTFTLPPTPHSGIPATAQASSPPTSSNGALSVFCFRQRRPRRRLHFHKSREGKFTPLHPSISKENLPPAVGVIALTLIKTAGWTSLHPREGPPGIGLWRSVNGKNSSASRSRSATSETRLQNFFHRLRRRRLARHYRRRRIQQRWRTIAIWNQGLVRRHQRRASRRHQTDSAAP